LFPNNVTLACFIMVVLLVFAEKICANGIRSGANCVCKAGFTGKNCHLKMNCEGFERKIDGECAECKQNYEGKFCELPICKNGNVHEHEQRCVNCEEPYSGDHCSNLKKSDVLYYYNKKMKMMGPIGVLSIIPMILIFLYCERKSNARKVNRVVSIYDGDSMDTNKLSKQAVRRLLVEKQDTQSMKNLKDQILHLKLQVLELNGKITQLTNKPL
uniref:EGF-like domain-containing protein n=1 Tax=Rhabditophanes sp. KR3021 TaxID=114890 RepID=A0AC35UAI7_9BILA